MARCEVKVIEDSIHGSHRLTTLELEYPLYIHAEFMTHRVFSRNAQSNRAIPVLTLIKRVRENDWTPIWVENQKGMTASNIITDPLVIQDLNFHWYLAKETAIQKALDFTDRGVHKQIVNRLLSPFQTIKVIVSSTEWNNFFRLRIHPAAQQEIQELATMMRDAIIASKPTHLDLMQWHLPYVSQHERDIYPDEQLVKISTARCARVSYLNHDGIRDIAKDIELHDSLAKEKHMSPFEHIATPFPGDKIVNNFRGWRQYRQYIEQEFSIY